LAETPRHLGRAAPFPVDFLEFRVHHIVWTTARVSTWSLCGLLSRLVGLLPG
jgi:hypothetical protein